MINVTGNVYVTNLKEVSPRLITGTIYSFEKVGEDFIPTFIKAKFVGDAITFLINDNVKDKDKVVLDSGIIKANTWTDKNKQEQTTLEITVFKLSRFKPTEGENKANQNSRFKR